VLRFVGIVPPSKQSNEYSMERNFDQRKPLDLYFYTFHQNVIYQS